MEQKKDLKKHTCLRCNRVFVGSQGFVSHMSRKYGLTSEQAYCEANDIVKSPLCKCGCGTAVEFHTFTFGYWGYKRGHASTGSHFTKETKAKSEESYRNNLASGKTVRIKKEKAVIQKEFQCFRCLNSYDSLESLVRHCARTHEMKSVEIYMEYNNISEFPKCACGCKEMPIYLNAVIGFREYKPGHAARVNNNYQTEKSIKNSQATRKQMIKDGDWKPFTLLETGEHWGLGLTKETDVRISNLSKSILKNEQETHIRSNNMKECWDNGKIKPLKGPDSSAWRGGVSSLNGYSRVHKKLYTDWKYPNLIRAGFQCEICFGNEGGLEVHHDKETFSNIVRTIAKKYEWEKNIYESLNSTGITNELIALKDTIAEAIADYHIDNKVSGLVLCEVCHKALHKSYNFSKKNQNDKGLP